VRVDTLDPAPSVVAAKPWRVAILAGVASYLDAGTIVAVSASLSLWQGMFHMNAWEVGFLSGALTVCIGIGAVLGGWIGDRWGRKRVYSIDLLLYAFGLLWIIFAVGTPMLFVAAIVVGLAVGADVPTSLALLRNGAHPLRHRAHLHTDTAAHGVHSPRRAHDRRDTSLRAARHHFHAAQAR
jgi:MFS transporter, SP family, inositol transporter